MPELTKASNGRYMPEDRWVSDVVAELGIDPALRNLGEALRAQVALLESSIEANNRTARQAKKAATMAMIAATASAISTIISSVVWLMMLHH